MPYSVNGREVSKSEFYAYLLARPVLDDVSSIEPLLENVRPGSLPREVAKLVRHDGDVRNGVEGAAAGYTGGHPRQWASNSRRLKRLEAEAAHLIGLGYNDYEIAEELFGKRTLYKRIRRFRAHLG